jgi:hypothetical protein
MDAEDNIPANLNKFVSFRTKILNRFGNNSYQKEKH